MLTEELEAHGVSVKEVTVRIDNDGSGPYVPSAVIVLDVEYCTDEEAERIFDEIIFPYMSRDNNVISNLMMPGGGAQQFIIEVSGEDGLCHYSSKRSRQRCELWENQNGIVCLEDYR